VVPVPQVPSEQFHQAERSLICVKKFLGSRWVDELGDDWRKETIEFQEATHDVVLMVLRAFAIALGREEFYFADVSLRI
jgi:isopenicillin N synthase-like dioxygenase